AGRPTPPGLPPQPGAEPPQPRREALRVGPAGGGPAGHPGS
ncbi:hypothetical protein SAMN02746019_00028090, partial [Thermoflexus hugenholtzii JAD2]